MKTVILAALTFAIACVVAGLIVVSRPAAREAASSAVKAAHQPEPARPRDEVRPPAPPAEAPPAVADVAAPPTPSVTPQDTAPPKAARADLRRPSAAAPLQRGSPAKEPLHDPLAREALALVGADPMAEAYWYAAINDPKLPANERQDLIEDLNEDGLSDPKHPGPEDLPLILSRLRLIEETGPNAIDQVNAEAFQEAYKDLLNLANLAAGGGEPVR
jgi:hypothetical protein